MACESKLGLVMDISCECGERFCFGCNKDAHKPVDCDLLQTWMDCLSEYENIADNNWMKVNTKKCPKCKVPIEKNHGCMHMTCSSCNYEFCWLCLGNYRNHERERGTYLCGNFEDVERSNKTFVIKGMNDAVVIEWNHKRMEYYATRFYAH